MPLSHSRRRLLGRSLRISTLLSLALASPLAALADAAYPDKPVKFVVPYPPGGGTDVVARIVQQRLQAALGQSIVIENKGGASARNAKSRFDEAILWWHSKSYFF